MPDPTPAQLRRVDALAAVHVMGWTWNALHGSRSGGEWVGTSASNTLIRPGRGVGRYLKDWSPTTSITDAMELVRKLQERNAQTISLVWSNLTKQWKVSVFYRETLDAWMHIGSEEDTLPMSITLATLRAVGVPEEEINAALAG